MSDADKIKWDLKFSKDLTLGVGDSALNDFLSLKPIKPVLDFACGDGRNSLGWLEKELMYWLGTVRGLDCKGSNIFFR